MLKRDSIISKQSSKYIFTHHTFFIYLRIYKNLVSNNDEIRKQIFHLKGYDASKKGKYKEEEEIGIEDYMAELHRLHQKGLERNKNDCNLLSVLEMFFNEI